MYKRVYKRHEDVEKERKINKKAKGIGFQKNNKYSVASSIKGNIIKREWQQM